MARATYVLRDGKLVEKQFAPPLKGIHVIRDEMDATQHMADGRIYTSKRKFRNATRAAGCVEVGNDPMTAKPVEMSKRERQQDIATAWAQMEAGYRPPALDTINHRPWENS